MKQQKRLGILIIIILFISIGFAYLSANLDIMGIANVRKMKWNIYFDNIKNYEHEDYFTEKPQTTGTTTTSLNFKVSLEDPGDGCSFNVDVINDGTINAMVNLITKSNIDEEDNKLFTYEVTYNDGTPISSKNFLGAGRSDTYKVSVKYNRDIEIADLPSTDKEISFNIQIEYQQAKESDDRINTNKTIIKDLSGNANHGKIVGATRTDDGTIITDGINDYIDCGLTNEELGDKVSLVLKIKLLSHTSDSNNLNTLFGNWESAGGGILINRNKLSADYKTDNKEDFVWFNSNQELELNKWYTIVSVYDGTKMKLYLNGSPIALSSDNVTTEVALTGAITPSEVPFVIGGNAAKAGGVGMLSNAEFETAMIFKRALSAEEVQTNYAEIVNPTNKKDLLLYYDFK